MGLRLDRAAQPANLLVVDRLDPNLAVSVISALLAAWQVYIGYTGRRNTPNTPTLKKSLVEP